MAIIQQRTVLRLDLPDDRQKKKALKAIATLDGIDSIAIETRAQKVTIVGCVDPVHVVNKLRKLWFKVHIVSVVPAAATWKEEHPRPPPPKKPEPCPPPPPPPKNEEPTPPPLLTEEKPPPPPPSPEAEHGPDNNHTTWTPRELTYEFLSTITNNFSEERIIGGSGYGVVYKGVRDDGEHIAVKKFQLMPGIDDVEFRNGFNNLMRVQHKNTIRLFGYCHHRAQVQAELNGNHVSARVEERALCFEYLEGGSLDKHLSTESCELPWHTCYKIIKGICEGLHYLQNRFDYPIEHLDLKPTKILLDKDMTPKIGGFGFSRLIGSIETFDTSEITKTSVYMPPEYINKSQITKKFDVFSLGVMIIQIMVGKERYSKCADIPPEEFVELVYQYWVNRMQATMSELTSHEVITCIEIALKCVESDPVNRPTTSEIVQSLSTVDIVELRSLGQLYRTRKFTFEFLERITNGFSEQNVVGRGGYGVVYKGVLDNEEEIAVKKLNNQKFWIDDEQFKNELNHLMRVQHKNIVRLVGYCDHTTPINVEYNGQLVCATVIERAICLDYLLGGSLDKQISDEPCRLDWSKCYKIIEGICQGLHYLYHNESSKPIFHLDLKPANILLDKDMQPIITDFGLSRLFNSMQTYITQSQDFKGTRGYMPPEFLNRQEISSKFDVFSLGVIIIQIMAGKEGYFRCPPYTPRKKIIQLVRQNWRKRLQATNSSHGSEEVRTCIEIALKCVEDDRVQRPTIDQIVNELSKIGTVKRSPIGQVRKNVMQVENSQLQRWPDGRNYHANEVSSLTPTHPPLPKLKTRSLPAGVKHRPSDRMVTHSGQHRPLRNTAAKACPVKIHKPVKIKRKVSRSTSEIWEHFIQLDNKDGPMVVCRFCNQVYVCDPAIHGTSTLRTHLQYRCASCPFTDPEKRRKLTSQDDHQFNVDDCRRALIMDEYPFSAVDGESFREYSRVLRRRFELPSRHTVARDCVKIYLEEKAKLKETLKHQRVCLTIDTWRSTQNQNYVSLIAHWINSQWKVESKVLNFCFVSDYAGDTLGRKIEECLLEWDIGQIFTITVDNASSNNLAIQYLKTTTKDWESTICNNEFLHVRCCGHIVNLVVKKGWEDSNASVARIRTAVNFVRSSPARLELFKRCVLKEKIMEKCLLSLDVDTSWKCSYLMLNDTVPFEKAFKRISDETKQYAPYFAKVGGPPTVEDWMDARKLISVFKLFYNVIVRFSEQLYVTSTGFFHDFLLMHNKISLLIREKEKEVVLGSMGEKMKQKFDEYWDNHDGLNPLLFIVVALDPRYKLKYLDFCFSHIYDKEKAKKFTRRIEDGLTRLFEWYDKAESAASKEPLHAPFAVDLEECADDPSRIWASNFREHLKFIESKATNNELSRFLAEFCEEHTDDFNILSWWRGQRNKYPTLSKVAKDVLAVPVSTVASEATFSTGGRVISPEIISLSPKMMEALIRAHSWLSTAPRKFDIRQTIDDLHKYEELAQEITAFECGEA